MTKIEKLKNVLDNSKYTVALCGSGMMEEGGFIGVKRAKRAYDLEKEYGDSPEEIFSSLYYNTRPDQFFEFYKNEMLKDPPEPTESGKVLADMERAGKLQCVITGNIYELEQRSGCKNVINLHGSVYENICPRCNKKYPLEYMINAKKVPICEKCDIPIRPMVSLFGEMVDSKLMTKTTQEIAKAEVLLLLGTNLNSEVFANYIRYYEGNKLIVIHQREHYTDSRADFVIIDQPKNVLPLLGY